MKRLVVGTYTAVGNFGGRGDGVHLFDLDAAGARAEPRSAFTCGDPTFLAASATGDRVYAGCHVNRFEGRPGAGILALRPADLALDGSVPVPFPHISFLTLAPSHRALLVACSFGGTVGTCDLRVDGSLGAWRTSLAMHGTPTIARGEHPIPTPLAGATWMHTPGRPRLGESAHPHCLIADATGRLLFATDLAQGTVTSIGVDPATAALRALDALELGGGRAGPRLLVRHPRLSLLYCVNEYAGTVSAIAFDPTGSLRLVASAGGAPGSASAAGIALSADATALYVTDRTTHTLSAFDVDRASGSLELAQVLPSGGRWPHHVTLAPGDDRLYVCNSASDAVTGFARSPDGTLEPLGAVAHVPTPACSLVLDTEADQVP